MSEAVNSDQQPAQPLPTRRQKISIVPWVAVFITCAIIAAWLTKIYDTTSPVPDRSPKKIFLPVSYTGKIKITYGIEEAEPLEKEDGYYIIDVPLSGIVETSTKMEWGRAVDEFYRKLPTPDESGKEYERLSFNHIKNHKSGLVGDDQEFFESPEEMDLRDPAVVSFYEENKEEAQQKMTAGESDVGIPAYELFIIRDDI